MLSAVGVHPLSPPLTTATGHDPLNKAFPPPRSPGSRPRTPLFDETAPVAPRARLSPEEPHRPLFPESPPRDPSIASKHDHDQPEESLSPKLVRRASSGMVASLMSRSRSRSSVGRLLAATPPDIDDDDDASAADHPRPIPTTLSLPSAPHTLSISALEQLPIEQLVALVSALSRERDADRLELGRLGRECDALEGMARGKGAGEGELKRARVRARVDEAGTSHEELKKEWRIALREEKPVPAPPQEEEAAPTKTETELDLDDLADAIGENAFDFSGNSQSSQLGDDDDGTDEVNLNLTAATRANLQDDTASIHSRLSPPEEHPSPSADTPIASRIKPSLTNATPRAVPATHRSRQASLSSRLFGQFAPPSAKDSSATSPSSSPTPSSPPTSHIGASTVSLIAGLGLSGAKRPASIRSVASMASVRSAAGSVVEGGAGESWLGGWGKGWSKGHKKKGSVVTENGVPTAPEFRGVEAPEDAVTDDSDDVDGPSRGGQVAALDPTTSSGTNHTGTTQLDTTLDNSPAINQQPDDADLNSSPSSPIESSFGFSPPPSHSTATPESVNPPATPAKVPPAASQSASPRHQTESPTLLRPRGPSMPLVSASQALGEAARPGLSTSDSPTRSSSRRSSRGSAITSLASQDLASHLSASGMASYATSAVADEYEDERAEEAGALLPVEVDEAEGQATIKARASARTLSPAASSAGGATKPFLQPATPLYLAPEGAAATKPKDKGYAASARGHLNRALGLGASASFHGGARSSAIHFPRAVSANSAGSEPALTLFPIPKLPSLTKYSPFAEPALARPITAFELAPPKSPVLPSTRPVGPPPPVAPGNAPLTMELGTLTVEEDVGLGLTDEEQAPLTDQFGFVFSKKDGLAVLKEKRARAAAATRNGETASTNSQETVDFAVLDSDSLDQAYQNELDQAEVAALHEALAIPPTTTNPSRTGRAHSNSSASRESATRPLRSPSLPSTASAPERGSSTRQTMKRLLEQRKAIDSVADRALQKDWDKFLLKRQEAKAKVKAKAIAEAKHAGAPASSSKAKEGLAALLGGQTDDGLDEEVEAGWGGGELVGVAEMGLDDKTQWNEFKSLIKQGIPMAYRAKVWSECLGASQVREPGYYHELLAKHRDEPSAAASQIDLDCHRTFPTNVHFAGNGPMTAKLRNVLVAYSWKNPEIGYCQGMNNLAATLLLVHSNEEDAFWDLVRIIEEMLPEGWFTAPLLVAQADQRVLLDLVERFLPDVAAHLLDTDVDLSLISFGWFLSLFTDSLHIQTLLRVWDLIFVLGSSVMFRVALALLQINSAEIFACDSASDMYALLRGMTGSSWQAGRLVKVATDDARFKVGESKVQALRARHVRDMQVEFGLVPAGEGAVEAGAE